MSKEPNHICKHCGKAYYYCNNCGEAHNFHEMACSPECYLAYQEAVFAARNPKTVVNAQHFEPESTKERIGEQEPVKDQAAQSRKNTKNVNTRKRTMAKAQGS